MPPPDGRQPLSIPWLEPAKTYAGFNGNKVLKGRGYRLMTDNGWLVRAGYRTDEIQPFLSDLAALAKPLGLVAVGIEHPTQTCHDLKQMQRLSFTLSGRRLLDKLHLRIYSEADYLQRWNQYFRWPAAAPETTQHDDVSVMALATAMTEHGISQRALAQNLQVDPAYLNKVLSGKKPAPQKLLRAAINWIAANAKPQTPAAHSSADSPLPQSSGILEQALAYQARGWSILPQRPAEKKPYIRWRRFQDL